MDFGRNILPEGRVVRVCHLIWALEAGGAERQVVTIASWQKQNGYEPMIVCLTRKGLFAKELEEQGIPVHHLPKAKGFDFSYIGKLAVFFKEHQVDIVHTHVPTANLWGRLAAKKAKTPIVFVTEHSALATTDFKFRILNKFLTQRTDRYILVSNQIQDAMVKGGISPLKTKVIHNGIQMGSYNAAERARLRSELEIAENVPVVGVVGRLEERKDHKNFLKGCKVILKSYPDAVFLVIGDGPLREELEGFARAQGIAQKVKFLGTRSDISSLLSVLDCYVLSSTTEGISISLLEAMAHSRPCVVTRVGGNPEVVQNQENGVLVAASDSHALGSAVVGLLKDPVRAQKLGARARETVLGRFSTQKMMKEMDALYQSHFQKLGKPKIAFVVSKFPCYDEAFILRELVALANQMPIRIFSLKSSKDKIVHDDADRLMPCALYIPFISPKVIWDQIVVILTRPIRYFHALFELVGGNLKKPEFLIKNLVLFPKAVSFARWALKERVPHLHGYWATYPASVALVAHRISGIPFSFTGHAHDIYLDTTHLKEKMDASRFISTCTASNKDYLAELAPNVSVDKILINHHGLYLDKFLLEGKKRNKTFQIVSVGTLHYYKGFNYLIDAAKILKERQLDFHVTIVGGGPREADLKAQIKKLNVGDVVTMTGPLKQHEVIPYHVKADVNVLMAQSEWHWGIPNVFIEAYAAKTPVITTQFGSVEELVKHEKTGLIVEAKKPEGLADAIEKYYSDDAYRIKLGLAGHELVTSSFDIRKNIKEFGRRMTCEENTKKYAQ